MEYENYHMVCGECGAKFELRATINRGFADREDVDCPVCKRFVATIRADMGYEITKVIEK